MPDRTRRWISTGGAALLIAGMRTLSVTGLFSSGGRRDGLEPIYSSWRETAMRKDGGPSLAFTSQFAGYDSIPQMASAADAIVVGRVVSSSQSIADNALLTTVAISISLALKGEVTAHQHIAVVQLGGKLPDGRYVEVDGEPPFEPGVNYLLFLRHTPSGMYEVLGGAQGSFVVEAARLIALGAPSPPIYKGNETDDTGAQELAVARIGQLLG